MQAVMCCQASMPSTCCAVVRPLLDDSLEGTPEHRGMGRDTFFLTGSDEHGSKIEQTALSEGIPPIQLCDRYVQQFKELYSGLNMSYDCFVRTSSQQHRDVAQEVRVRRNRMVETRCRLPVSEFLLLTPITFFSQVFKRSFDAGDIYLGEYEGWYNAREEAYVSDTDAAMCNHTDPITGQVTKNDIIGENDDDAGDLRGLGGVL